MPTHPPAQTLPHPKAPPPLRISPVFQTLSHFGLVIFPIIYKAKTSMKLICLRIQEKKKSGTQILAGMPQL